MYDGRIVAICVLVSVLSTPAWPDPASTTAHSAIPTPSGLQGHVAFWRDVFSKYDLGTVVVHHMDQPSLVYEVVAIPGERGNAYTEDQREFVDRLREQWEDRLGTLISNLESGSALSVPDRELAQRCVEVLGQARIMEADRRVRTQRGLRERFRRGLEIGRRYEAEFRRIFRDAGLPEDLAHLPHVESSYQVAARSSAGALGVWQFTRGTARRYLRVNAAIDERLDPVASARGAADYLGEAYERLGDWALAVTSYNHGVAGMTRARQALGDDFMRIIREYDGSTFGFASRNFYAEFLAAREIARDPERFFPEGLAFAPPLDEEFQVLKRSASPARLAREFGVPLARLAELNPAWSRRALYSGLSLPAGSTVWLPSGTLERHRSGTVPRSVDLSLPDLVEGDMYVVLRGDSLWTIADRFGLTVDRLRALNGMGQGEDRIYAGERLRVGKMSGAPDPASGSLTHTVRRGDTLIAIAARYGVRLSALMSANRLSMDSVIIPGQKLSIPGT